MSDNDNTWSDSLVRAQSEGASGWRTALGNYRRLLGIDNGLVWLLNLGSAAIGYATYTQVDGLAGLIVGGILMVSGVLGILDSLIGRVMQWS